MIKTSHYSYKIGRMAKGCRQCVKGEKLVLFVTGICNRGCFYCPLSEEKKNQDVLFANEWDTELKKELTSKQIDIILKEAELCNSKGAGITGGDPLLVIDRTVKLIEILKKKFGKEFHIHLYTPLENINVKKLEMLNSAGLDEIRFHPKVWDKKLWNRINLASSFSYDIGVEIPVIPEYIKETKELIDYLSGKINFINLNELEISDTNAQKLIDKGYEPKDRVSYGVLNSEESAFELLDYIEKRESGFSVHYCTTKLKDSVQMKERIKRRAKNIAFKFDKITTEGMLIRGAIYLVELVPSFSYMSKIKKIPIRDRKIYLKKLNESK